jgi:S-adenosylhomocysteine hydrolase/8-oxo-dGTP pyrophosphatase MutT (NUDIX family)
VRVILQQSLGPVIKEYLSINEAEGQSLGLLLEQIKNDRTEQMLSRKNCVGHITASIFIVTKNKNVLLLQHKKLNKLLQPGGHIDAADVSTLAAALRELEEETGLTEAQLTHRSLVPGREITPFHISTHHIPENPSKHEDAHYHHDFQYLAVVEDEHAVTIDPSESNSWQWIDWEEFKKLGTFVVQVGKIERLLAKSPEHFLSQITSSKNQIALLVVAHVLPSMLGPLRFLKNNFDLIGVIPKPKSIDETTYKRLEKDGINFLRVTREDINVEFVTNTIRGKENVVLIDIGGYFSSVATDKKLTKSNILGIVEDTENGQQKYQRVLRDLSVPVYSVARSPLKDNEDYLVGQAIAHATNTLLRQTNKLMAFEKCGVIGYGKVGQGICDYLMNLRIKPVVCEANPERLLRAYNHGCEISTSVDDVIGTRDIIFCATGSQVLDIHKFRKVKNGAYIASVTSSDDEFKLDYLQNEYQVTEMGGGMTDIDNGINHFHLLNNGNAVNFLYNASLGEFIYLVQAEIIQSVLNIAENRKLSKTVLHTVDAAECQHIAELWLKEFA